MPPPTIHIASFTKMPQPDDILPENIILSSYFCPHTGNQHWKIKTSEWLILFSSHRSRYLQRAFWLKQGEYETEDDRYPGTQGDQLEKLVTSEWHSQTLLSILIDKEWHWDWGWQVEWGGSCLQYRITFALLTLPLPSVLIFALVGHTRLPNTNTPI